MPQNKRKTCRPSTQGSRFFCFLYKVFLFFYFLSNFNVVKIKTSRSAIIFPDRVAERLELCGWFLFQFIR